MRKRDLENRHLRHDTLRQRNRDRAADRRRRQYWLWHLGQSGLLLLIAPRFPAFLLWWLACTYNLESTQSWPLRDIGITNIVWCMVYQREVGGGSCIAQ